VPAEVKLQRNQTLLEDLEAGVEVRNRGWIGRQAEVLVEGPSLRNPARWQGRSDNGKVVLFEPGGAVRPGDLAQVLVERATSHSLFGRLVP